MDYSPKPGRKNPRKGVNPLSQLLFLWLVPLFWKGLRKGIDKDDRVICLAKDESKKLGDELDRQWNKEIERAKRRRREPQLRSALFRMFMSRFFFDGISILSFVFIRTCVPLVLAQLLLRIKDAAKKISSATKKPLNQQEIKNSGFEQFFLNIWNDSYWLAGLICLMILVSMVISHHSELRLQMTGSRMRIACCSLIYRKSLRLSEQTASTIGIGHLVNLLTNDVSHLDDGFVNVHYIWMLPIQSILVCYFLWQRVQWAALVGVLAILLQSIPVQILLITRIATLRMKLSRCIDTRIGIMNEIIENIRVIKMYAWEIPFEKVVAAARRYEFKQLRYLSRVNGISMISMAFIDYTTIFISIATCLLTGLDLTADLIFPMNLYFDALEMVAKDYFPEALTLGAEALISIKRVEKFLLMDETDDFCFRLERRITYTDSDHNSEDAILINDVSASWKKVVDQSTLKHITLRIRPGKLYAIVGPVGCGKSSLMQLILGELQIQCGHIIINGSISYAGDKPWLFSGTIRNNILFGQKFDRIHYEKVIRCCALIYDFDQLPFGDQTQIDEHGTTLTRSQRSRISFARAIYKKASIYIFDNPISTVEPYIVTRVFDDVIDPRGLIENATRILVTHRTHFLKKAHVVVSVKNGTIANTGSYAELLESDLDLAELVRNETTNYEFANDDYYSDKSNVRKKDAAQRKSTASKMSRFSRASQPFVAETIKIHERLTFSTWKAFKLYMLSGTNCCGFIWMFTVMVLSLVASSWVDYFLTFWTKLENSRLNGEAVSLTKFEYLGIYGSMQIGLILIFIYHTDIFIRTSLRASTRLHNRMLHGVLYAPMYFFQSTTTASLLDSFSDDLNAVDENVPVFVHKSILSVMKMMSALLVIVIMDQLMLVAILCEMVILYSLIKFHSRTSRDLVHLSGSAYRSVLSHITATISGLTTIRTRNISTQLIDEFHGLQNVHSAMWQLVQSAKAARDLWMDFTCFLFVATVTFTYLSNHKNEFNGNLGVVMVQAISLVGKVKSGIRKETQIIGGLICVKKVLELVHIEPELSPDKEPPEDWPKTGKIKMDNMSVRNNPKKPPTVKNVQLEIESGCTVGIVGRTGVEKKSLIDALFRLTYVDGIIEIDGINTGTISLSTLRQKIDIIPQDPVLFSNTVRYNLDPFGKQSDDAIWKVLEEVELKSMIKSLDYHVIEGGTNFSQGQRQLIYLARAILTDTKILVIEQTTADLNPEIDTLARGLFNEHFTNATIIVVANNLFTIIDAHRVLVMDAGRAMEYDIPYILLQNESSLFRRMIDSTGPYDSQVLKKLATEKFNEISRNRNSK